jgi:hypothetical protein
MLVEIVLLGQFFRQWTGVREQGEGGKFLLIRGHVDHRKVKRPSMLAA